MAEAQRDHEVTATSSAVAPATRPKPRLLLADDHLALLDSLSELLAPTYDVVAAVADGESLVQAALELEPDLILTDIGMPRLNGLDAVAALRCHGAGVRVVFYTVDQDIDTAAEAIRRGATGYVAKAAPMSALLDVLRAAMAGETRVVLR
jgi:DNA-binding NarL/FixJ family response regulator